MHFLKCTAGLAVLLLPAVVAAQENAEEAGIDEVIVVGRSISTSLARIEVDREMLVDTATVLKDIPGANVNANGPVTGIAQYRGMYGDRIAVVIDHLGVVSGGPNAMDAPLSYVSPMITEELAVTRGIASVSLAPESIGGYVAAQLSRGEFSAADPALSGFVGTRYSGNGNVNTSAGRITLSTSSHKVSLVAEVDDGEDVSTPAGDIRPSRLHRERSDLSYAYSDDRTSILLFAGRLDTDDTGTPALPMDIRFIDTNLAGATLSLEISDTIAVEGRIAWNDVEHLMDNFGLRLAPAPMGYRQSFTTGSGTQLSLATSIGLTDSTLKLGLDSSTADHDATITNPNNAMFRVANFAGVKRDMSSVFAEWQHNGNGNGGELELGLRARRVEAGAGNVSADGLMGGMGTDVALLADAFNTTNRSRTWNSIDAVAKYRLPRDTGTEWSIELGSKTRAPSYQELYLWLPMQSTGGLADGRSYIGGLNLDAERSNEIAVGLGKNIGPVTVSPQFFYRRVDGYIQGIPSSNSIANRISQMMSGMPALEFANVDAEIWGADIAWKVELADRWYLDGIASFARGKRRDIDDNLYRLAPPNASAGLTWKGDALSITTKLTGYARQEKVSAYNDEQHTPGYGLLGAALIWNPNDALRLEARVDNLFDKAYQDHVAGINRAGGSDIAVGTRLYGMGRAMSVGVILSF